MNTESSLRYIHGYVLYKLCSKMRNTSKISFISFREMWIVIVTFFHLIDSSSVVESKYSSVLTADSRTYSRVCGRTNYYYETIQVNVQETGNYSFRSGRIIKTFGYIYKDNFDPFNPVENLLSQDGYGCLFYRFHLISHLQVNTTYILVVTTFSPNVQGNFSVHVTGPNKISLNRTILNGSSEYFYFFVNK